MADQQQPKGAKKPAPYPSNWGRMTAGQKRSWMAANRPGEPPAPRFAPAARQPTPATPTPAPAPSEEQGAEEQGAEEYPDQDQARENLTITLDSDELGKLDGRQLVAEILRTIANGLDRQSE